MAFQALGWLQKTIGIDITGEQEFQEHHTTVLHKKEDEPTPEQPEELTTRQTNGRSATKGSEPTARTDGSRRSSERRHRKKHVVGDRTLVVTPSKFYFPLPLDKYIMNTVTAQNTSDSFVQFKVKATAPARYAVKPRQAVLAPREQLEIHVTLRPTKDDPVEMRDKFLIQYRTMAAEEVTQYKATGDPQAVWQGKKDIMGTKIRCKFTSQLPPNFIVKSVAEQDDDDGAIGTFEDDDDEEEAGELLPDRQLGSVPMQQRRHVIRRQCNDDS